jgi:RNA polymerase-associated protein
VVVAARGRSLIALYSSPISVASHRVRFILAEKGINVEVIDVEAGIPNEDLVDLNPDQSTPTLVDRDLVLYDVAVIAEYLDERYPHPPMMPVDPVSRARLRLAMFRLQKDWYALLPELESGDNTRMEPARRQLSEDLLAANDLFAVARYFLHDDLTLVDCALAPFLWRLEHYGIEVPASAIAVTEYCEMVFDLPSFQESLTEQEREMRP